MKKILLPFVVLFSLLCSPVFAFEWGGLLRSSTEYISQNFSDYDLLQTEEVFAWGKIPFGKNSPFSLTGELVYKGIFNISDAEVTLEDIIDVDIFKISGTLEFGQSSSLYLALGRFNAVDSSRKVFTQLLDGAAFSVNFPLLNISAFGGFTGFINSHSAAMMESDGEVFSAVTPFYSLNIPYLVGEGKIEIPSIFGTSLSVEGLGFFDTRDFTKNRYFGEIASSGPFMDDVFYKFSTVVGLNDNLEFTNYTSIDYIYYPSAVFSVDFGLEYASGNIGPLKAFYPVTSQVSSSALSSPVLSGVLIPNLGFTLSVGSFYADLSSKFVFAWPEKEIKPAGAEADFTSQLNIFSDLKLTMGASFYYDLMDIGDTNFSASVGASISF